MDKRIWTLDFEILQKNLFNHNPPMDLQADILTWVGITYCKRLHPKSDLNYNKLRNISLSLYCGLFLSHICSYL